MKVEIRDKEALESLSACKSALISQVPRMGGQRTVGHGTGESLSQGAWREVLQGTLSMPVRDTLADYAQAMAEAVEAIAAVEERSELCTMTWPEPGLT